MKFKAFLVAAPLVAGAFAAHADTQRSVGVIYALGEQSSVGIPLAKLSRTVAGPDSGGLPSLASSNFRSTDFAPPIAVSRQSGVEQSTKPLDADTNTMLMLLTGLGVMGSIARRRRLARKSL